MTLIITAAADDATVQVVDQLLTMPDGTVFSDDSIKSVCVECADSCFSIAYTGLPRLGTTPTDHWLAESVTKLRPAEKRFPDLIEGLRQHASTVFCKYRSLGNSRGVTFVCAGFGPPGPVMAILSNQEDSEGKWLPSVVDDFQAGYFLRNSRSMRRLDIMISGTERAITSKYRRHR